MEKVPPRVGHNRVTKHFLRKGDIRPWEGVNDAFQKRRSGSSYNFQLLPMKYDNLLHRWPLILFWSYVAVIITIIIQKGEGFSGNCNSKLALITFYQTQANPLGHFIPHSQPYTSATNVCVCACFFLLMLASALDFLAWQGRNA